MSERLEIRTSYDDAGRVAEVEELRGAGGSSERVVTTFEYDDAGREVRMVREISQ